jgi:hypothetical protein
MAASNILTDKAIRAAIKGAVAAGKSSKASDGSGLALDARPTGAGWCPCGSLNCVSSVRLNAPRSAQDQALARLAD